MTMEKMGKDIPVDDVMEASASGVDIELAGIEESEMLAEPEEIVVTENK